MTSNTNSSSSNQPPEHLNTSYLVDLAKFSIVNLADFQHKIFETLCFSLPLNDIDDKASSELLELLAPKQKDN